MRSARSVTFPSVVIAAERPLLVQVKAVESPYPLRGRLRVETPAGEVGQVPADGEAWLEGRLRDRLGVQIGRRRSAWANSACVPPVCCWTSPTVAVTCSSSHHG